MRFVVKGLQREGAGLNAIHALFLKPGDHLLQLESELLKIMPTVNRDGEGAWEGWCSAFRA